MFHVKQGIPFVLRAKIREREKMIIKYKLPEVYQGFPVYGHGNTMPEARRDAVRQAWTLRARLRDMRSGKAKLRPVGNTLHRFGDKYCWTLETVEIKHS